MNIAANKYFLGLFCIVFTYFSIQSILPETIATATLLKYGGAATALAVGGRCVTLAAKEISQLYQTRFRKTAQAEFCNDSSSSDGETKNNIVQESIVKVEAEKSLLKKIKDIVLCNKDQQYQQQSFQADETHNSSADQKTTYWTQTNVHAQQARGFFPRVNNYHYHSSQGNFWQGATVGSFVTGTTCFYLVVKNKKD